MTDTTKDAALIALGAKHCWVPGCLRRATTSALYMPAGSETFIATLCPEHTADPPERWARDLLVIGDL